MIAYSGEEKAPKRSQRVAVVLCAAAWLGVVSVSSCGGGPATTEGATSASSGASGPGGGTSTSASTASGSGGAATSASSTASASTSGSSVSTSTTSSVGSTTSTGGENPDAVTRFMKLHTNPLIAVAIDATGGPILVGSLQAADQFGITAPIALAAAQQPGEPSSSSDLYVVKMDANGKALWGNRYGDTADQSGNAVAINANGVALVAGKFTGDLVLSPQITLSAPVDTSFLAAFDATGAVVWARALDLGGGIVYSIAVDPTDQGFVIAGFSKGDVTWGAASTVSGGGKDVFVAKVAGGASEQLLWARQIGGLADQTALGVAVDSSGSAIVVGQYNGALDFGGGALKSPGSTAAVSSMFVAKLDGSGGTLAAIGLGSTGGLHAANAVAVDAGGAIVIAGSIAKKAVAFDAATTLTPSPLGIGSPGGDGFVAKLSSDLKTAVWARRLGDDPPAGMPGSAQAARGVSVDKSGHVVVTGEMEGTVDFGVGKPITAVVQNGFALKLDGVAGTPMWVRSTGGVLAAAVSSVAIGSSDGPWVAGTFSSNLNVMPYANWGATSSTELIFATDNGATGNHTYLVQLAP